MAKEHKRASEQPLEQEAEHAVGHYLPLADPAAWPVILGETPQALMV